MKQANPQLFGQVAIRKGWVQPNEVDEALIRQRELAENGEPHKYIGVILLEKGVLSTTQLIEILREMNVPHDEQNPTRRFPRE